MKEEEEVVTEASRTSSACCMYFKLSASFDRSIVQKGFKKQRVSERPILNHHQT